MVLQKLVLFGELLQHQEWTQRIRVSQGVVVTSELLGQSLVDDCGQGRPLELPALSSSGLKLVVPGLILLLEFAGQEQTQVHVPSAIALISPGSSRHSVIFV